MSLLQLHKGMTNEAIRQVSNLTAEKRVLFATLLGNVVNIFIYTGNLP